MLYCQRFSNLDYSEDAKPQGGLKLKLDEMYELLFNAGVKLLEENLHTIKNRKLLVNNKRLT
jgi:hypothetical protein